MEGALVLVDLVVLAIPVAVIYLLVSHSTLKARVTALERALAAASSEKRRDTRPESGTSQVSAPAKPPQTAAIKEPVATEAATTADQKSQDKAAARVQRPTPLVLPASRPVPATVFADRATSLFSWLAGHWFYVVSALSLALAGLFLVQYGIESGWFPPLARVLAALGFGAALIGAGDYIRRHYGDDKEAATAYLPSVFSGAGLVSLFGGVAAAHVLYGLIGPSAALIGLAGVGLIGVGLGWLYGPLLAGVGVLGAFAAPFIVGAQGPVSPWLYTYFAITAAVGLGIDTLRRWAWVSVLSVVLAFGAGLMIVDAVTVSEAFMVYVATLVVLAILIPARSVWPDHSGPRITQLIAGMRPGFPTWLAAGAVLTTTTLVVMALQPTGTSFWLGITVLGGLSAALTVWSVRGPALQDLAAVPALGLLAVVGREAAERGVVYRAFHDAYAETPEAAFPLSVTSLVGVGLALGLLAAGRALRPGLGLAWAIAAALAAPAMAVLLEVTWAPAQVIGTYPWALHAAALAAAMVALALRFARVDGTDRQRASIFVLSALASLTFALVLILSSAALTVALAVVVVVAAWLDRRFDLPLMQLFISAGVVAVGARLVADPGLGWALNAPVWEVLLAYGGSLGAMLVGLSFLRGLPRNAGQVMLETGTWSAGGLLATVLLERGLSELTPGGAEGHAAMGLYASVWLGLAIVQVRRLQVIGGWMAYLRGGLAVVFGVIGLAALALGLTVFSPLLSYWAPPVVAGLPVLNTLAVAYLLPAAVLGLEAWVLRGRILGPALGGLGVALTAVWAFAMLRHVWQGADTMELRFGFLQGELWTYTVALLVVGAAVFYQALARSSVLLRRAGLVVIGLAVAKVFIVDISDLAGLTRVFSLVVLGLSLAGLAWLDRWAQARA